MKKTIALIATLALCGCASYQSKITLPNGTSMSLPKDAQFGVLVFRQTTNGVSLVITNGVFKMNPAVIDSATAHDIGLINAVTAALLQAAATTKP